MMTSSCSPSSAGDGPRWAVALLPDGHEITLELAVTQQEQARGYMGRAEISDREGMLFLYAEDSRTSFWMKNCLVSLDIIWLDADGGVVEVAANQPPCPEEGPCPSVIPNGVARYVLELAGGQAAVHDVRPGRRVALLFDRSAD